MTITTINQLLKENQTRLKKYITSRVDNPFEVDEILQETLISSIDAYPSFKNKSSFLTWLCAIANHEIVDYYRKRKIKTVLFSLFPFLQDLAEQALGPEQQLLKAEIERETEKRVRDVLRKLNEGYSEILRLRYYQHLSVSQIAQRLNESYKTIESRLSRARKAFAEIYLTGGDPGKLPADCELLRLNRSSPTNG